MKKIVLFFCFFIFGCAVTPFVQGPIITGIIMWKQGEARKYYNEDNKIVSDWEFYIYAICYKNVKYKYLKMVISDFDFTGISTNPKFKHIEHLERKNTLEKFFPAFVEDYEKVSLLNSKRFQQIIHIQKSSFLWILFKGMISFFVLFTSRFKK